MDDYVTTDTGTGIYGYLNLETNEIDYVGQTSLSFRLRDQGHRRKRQGKISPFDYKLQAHPDKYIMIPLAYCDDADSLNLLETFYIYYFNTIDKDNYTWGGDTLRGKWHPSFRNDLDNKEIKKLYINEGLSIYQIGEKFGTSDRTISNRLRKQGIKLRGEGKNRDDLDDGEIRKLYVEEGLSTHQIGEKFGTSHHTISTRLKRQGIKLRGKSISRNDLDDEEIKKLYIEEGLSTHQIGEKFGVAPSTINTRLRKQGIKLRGKSFCDDLDDKEIKKMYIEEGLSTYQIGEKFGVSPPTISTRLKKQGIKLRGKSISCNNLDDKEIKKLYTEEGLTINQISEKLGVSPSSIRIRLRNQGINKRNHNNLDEILTRWYNKTMTQLVMKNDK